MKKSFAIDKMNIYNLFAIIFMAFIMLIPPEQIAGVLIFESVVLLIMVVSFLMGPNYYVADSDGIAVYYFLFIKDYYKWDEIKSIEEYLAGSSKFYYTAYWIETKTTKKKPFYMDYKITKSIWTKRLIKKYWDGEIKGDDFEAFKKKLRKKKAESFELGKKQAIKSESEARTRIAEILREYRSTAKRQGLFVKATYSYEIENRTYDKRPDESYSFVVKIEMGKIGCSEDDKLYIISELLFVRYGVASVKVIEKDGNIYNEISQKVGEFVSL
ncbi:MAG: hypothetical protein IJW86_10550 [Clostridia bacterium]|nr:hypothetical protein [Clostridia bacterium]MBQ7296609.1 hypothetical protein [Clostridia bacterium]